MREPESNALTHVQIFFLLCFICNSKRNSLCVGGLLSERILREGWGRRRHSPPHPQLVLAEILNLRTAEGQVEIFFSSYQQ